MLLHSSFRKSLPIYAYKSKICDLLRNNEVILIVSETGSGKSTQIPQYFFEEKLSSNRICITQPRRVAAMTVAKRVSEELGMKLGRLVGYRVRFEDCSSKESKILYLTDGMLLREAMSDGMLSNYDIVILDEAHERSLQTDILFGIVKRAMECRRGTAAPLKVVIMSATLEIETFESFFPQSVKINVPGRLYPVEILYTNEAQDDYIDSALSTILQIHNYRENDGDMLVFLPGQEEIEDLSSLLFSHLQRLEDETINKKDRFISLSVQAENSCLTINGIQICPLYAALPHEIQRIAFERPKSPNIRKVILATNIAETSVTIENVKYVIDTLKCKVRCWNNGTGMESLILSNISQAQAAQRAGRAGRTSQGFCFRLCTEDAFFSLDLVTPPEILRVNLAHVVLQLKSIGIEDIISFYYVTPPSKQSLLKAVELLYALGALDLKFNLTQHGENMAKLPLDPIFANLILLSRKYNCVKEMIIVVAMATVETLFYRPHNSIALSKASQAHKRFKSYEGDLPTLLSLYQSWRRESNHNSSSKSKSKKSCKKRKLNNDEKHSHADWCRKNYINGRALSKAYDIQNQLSQICSRSTSKHGLNWDHFSTQKQQDFDMEQFLKCLCAGLFLQSASRCIVLDQHHLTKTQKKAFSNTGKYRTKISSKEVSIHPTSSLFGRNKPPKCVVYTELIVTKKNYIRGVTQIRDEWLAEVAPHFFLPEQNSS